jgi:hypothetical protein
VSFDGYNWTNGTTEFVKHAEFLENQVCGRYVVRTGRCGVSATLLG